MNPQLNEWNLPHGTEPHNPDGLTPEQITEGGKWRACVAGDVCMPGMQVNRSTRWGKVTWKDAPNIYYGKPIGTEYASHATLRVPITTPFAVLKESLTPQSATGQSKTHVKVFTLCPHCNKEAQATFVDGFSSFFNCPHCSRSSHLWLRLEATELTAALAERDEARRLLGEAKKGLEGALALIGPIADGYDKESPMTRPTIAAVFDGTRSMLCKTINQITNHLNK